MRRSRVIDARSTRRCRQPLLVVDEDIVDLRADIGVTLADEQTLGHPVHHAVREQHRVQQVGIAVERHREVDAAVGVGVNRDQRVSRPVGRQRHRCGIERRGGQGPRVLNHDCAGAGVGPEIREHALAGVGQRGRDGRRRSTRRPVEPFVGARPRVVPGDLPDAELRFVRRQDRGVEGSCSVIVRQDDPLIQATSRCVGRGRRRTNLRFERQRGGVDRGIRDEHVVGRPGVFERRRNRRQVGFAAVPRDDQDAHGDAAGRHGGLRGDTGVLPTNSPRDNNCDK